MSNAVTLNTFNGPYKELLGELSELIDWLRANHDLSFVKAGENAVFAYGGNGYVVIFDESIWAGLVEVTTPDGMISIKPGEDGTFTVTSSNPDEKSSKNSLKAAIAAIRQYYETRYWSTPSTSSS